MFTVLKIRRLLPRCSMQRVLTVTFVFEVCRSAWHLRDHVPLLRRMRWGAVPFANLRFRNGPHNRLPCAPV